jgi:hypothetical protein
MRLKRIRRPKVELTCPTCGKLFMVRACDVKFRAGYCSRVCGDAGKRKPENEKRPHIPTMVTVHTGRRCNICGRVIKAVPSGVDPRYARFCYKCRTWSIPEESGADAWLGRGQASGASTGWMVIGSGAR